MELLILFAALFLGFPLMIGLWTIGLKVKKFLGAYLNPQSSFMVLIGLLAVLVCVMTAPVYLLGAKGYLVICVIYIALVLTGAPHMRRVFLFLQREFDGDDSNDVDLGDKSAKK